MKRRDVIKKIAAEAKRQDVGWTFAREGANHSIYILGGETIPIPRHRARRTAGGRDLQGVSRRAWEGMVAEMKTYHADVSRDGKFWFIRIPEIGRSTQAIRYKDVALMAAELIEIMTGLGAEDYDLHLNVQLPSSVQDHRARAEVLREEASRKTAEAAAESRAAVHELVSLGLSQREVGEVLGLSYQRVNQLVNS